MKQNYSITSLLIFKGMKKSTQKRRRLAITLTAIFWLMLCSITNAEEGGSGHYVPGNMSTLIDLPPTKAGWVVEPLFLHYKGDVSDSITLPVAGEVTAGLDARIDSLVLGGLYTFEHPVLGAYFTVGAYVPYVWMEVTGALGGLSRTDKEEGLGDITLIPAMLAWKTGSWQFNALLPIYAPTGDYEEGRLANPGLNYWTFDPTVGAAYSNEQTGFNFAIHAGVTFNTENDATQYKSGSVLHTEISLQQLLPVGRGFLGLGLNAYLYEQIRGDSGSGATLGDFKGHSAGVGPVFNYILPIEAGTWVFEAKWLPELDTEKRLEGDYFWLKAVWQF